MPDGSLHEISVAIGELRAEVRTLFRRYDDMAVRIETRLGVVEGKVDKDVEEMKALKNRGWGVLFGLSLAAGAVGAWVADKLAMISAWLTKG
jgi:hypothetical protein